MVFSLSQIPTAFLGLIESNIVVGPGTLLAQMYTSGIVIGSTEEVVGGNYSF